MSPVSELMNSLRPHFKWHKARLYCLSAMILALFTVRTVNLQEIATAFFSVQAKLTSRYKRLQRFFRWFSIDFDTVARWLFHLFFSDSGSFYLTMDRTNWQWGKTKINIFMLGITYEGIAIPIYWKLLDNKGGSSNAKQQIALIQRFIKTFGQHQIAGILGDREFPNKVLCKWLVQKKIPFYFRMKEGALVKAFKKSKPRAIKHLFHSVPVKSQVAYPYPLILFGQSLQVAAGRSETGELMIVVTNQQPKNAVPIYLRRWEIENLFSALKSHGFRFEETNITDFKRLEKLTAVLAMAFCWAHKVGEWQADIKPILMKQYKDGTRHPQNTFF